MKNYFHTKKNMVGYYHTEAGALDALRRAEAAIDRNGGESCMMSVTETELGWAYEVTAMVGNRWAAYLSTHVNTALPANDDMGGVSDVTRRGAYAAIRRLARRN